jgi:hypothetical protein
MHDKQGHHGLPKLFAQSESGNCVTDGKDTGDHDANHKAERRLAPQLGDVAGERDGDEDEEDAKQEKQEGTARKSFPK